MQATQRALETTKAPQINEIKQIRRYLSIIGWDKQPYNQAETPHIGATKHFTS